MTKGTIVPAALALACFAFAAAAEPWTRHTIDDSSDGADGVRLADANGDASPTPPRRGKRGESFGFT